MTASPEELLNQAVRTVRDSHLDPDSAGGAEALRFLLAGGRVHEAASGSSADQGPGPDLTAPDAAVAKWANLDVEAVRDRVEFGDDALVRLPVDRLPRAKADRQRVIALMKLAIDRVGYGLDDVSAQRVNAACSEYACVDQNISHNIAARGDLITRRGKRGAYLYRITQPGLQRARELMIELFEGDGELRV
jgi:hypothetical protein